MENQATSEKKQEEKNQQTNERTKQCNGMTKKNVCLCNKSTRIVCVCV